MVNTNQNQNLNKLLDQSFQKKSAMEQGIAAGRPQMPTMAIAPKTKKTSTGGLLTKILMAVLFLFIIGMGVLGFIFYSDIDSKNTDQNTEIIKNQNLINTLIDKVDAIENNLSGIDTFEQKVEAIEAGLKDYATKQDLLPVMEFLKKQDSDQDGLTDYDEIVLYKSDPNKKDTDGDGYSDKAEVDSGYNPAGPGKLGEQDLSQEEKDIIVGDWSGAFSSEVAKSSEFKLNLTENNRMAGTLVFPGSTQNITYKSRVTGYFTFEKDGNNFKAMLINYFSVVDSAAGVNESATEREYKMEFSGIFSNETKQINGNWNVMGSTPSNWPAASSGTFSLTKAQQQSSNILDGSDDNDGGTVIPVQTVSVKAFSFGYSPATIKLVNGQRVTLELTSLDVAHTFTVDELGIDIKVQGGETVSIEYTPKQVGEFEFYCSVPGHKESGMVGSIIVEEAAK